MKYGVRIILDQVEVEVEADSQKEAEQIAQNIGEKVEGTVELSEEAVEHIDMLSGNKERDAVFRRCIRDYGTQPQIDMMIEEMSELTKALLKWRRAEGAELTAARGCIIDELADVRIMARQMEILFQAEEEVERRIDFKVQRQWKRLEERETQNGKD